MKAHSTFHRSSETELHYQIPLSVILKTPPFLWGGPYPSVWDKVGRTLKWNEEEAKIFEAKKKKKTEIIFLSSKWIIWWEK